MSVSSATNSLNLLVCSYRVPDDGQLDAHEDEIVEKEAQIYLIQAKVASHARFIIQRLLACGYKIYRSDHRGLYIALDPARFKETKEDYGISISVIAIDALTGIRVRSTSTQGGTQFGLGEYHRWSWDSGHNDLVLTAAPLKECDDFEKIYVKSFEAMDAGNLLVKTPIDHFDDKISRIFKSAFRYHKVKKLPNDKFLNGTFYVIHGRKQDSLLFSLVKPISKLFPTFSYPLITTVKNRLYTCIPSAEFFSRAEGKSVLAIAAVLYLYNVHHIITTLGLTLLNPLMTLPPRVWILHNAFFGNNDSDYQEVLAAATLGILVWSMNAPLIFCLLSGKLGDFILSEACENFTTRYYLKSRLALKARILGMVAGIALFETANLFATGGYKSFIDFFSPYNHMSAFYNTFLTR